jgi:hypothetical protein
MAMADAAAPIRAAIQETKQRWNASASSAARMSPRWSWAGVPCANGRNLRRKPGNVTNRLSARQNRRQAHKQNLIQGTHHLAALAMIQQILEMIKKYNSLRKVQTIVHRNPSKTNQRNSTDSALYPFVIRLFHPIALPTASRH